jgi:MFS family permease
MRWLVSSFSYRITCMTGISSAIIAPTCNVIGDEFDIHTSFQKQLNFSIIKLAYVIGPLVSTSLSKVYGQSFIFQLANIFLLIFNLLSGIAWPSAYLVA